MMQKIENAYKVAVHVGRLQRPPGALWGKRSSPLGFGFYLDTLYRMCVCTQSPAGHREPRTWAEGCRGTAPSAPSSLGLSGVSGAKERRGGGFGSSR